MRREVLKKFGSICLVCALVFSVIPYEVVSAKQNILKKETVVTNAGKSSSNSNSERKIFLSGEGKENDPYLISNASELKDVLDAIDGKWNRGKFNFAYFKLTSDISMNNVKIHEQEKNKQDFSGEFDGNGHTISELDATALFYGLDGRVKNLNIKNSKFSVAAIAQKGSEKTEITNCNLDKDVTITIIGKNITIERGGMIGKAHYIKNCVSKATYNVDLGSERSGGNIGGIVGSVSEIEGCTFEGELNVYGDGRDEDIQIGGVTGSAYNCLRCNNKGKISVARTSKYYLDDLLGGVIGRGTARLCNNSANINLSNSDIDIGGIIGRGNVRFCSNSGNITGGRSVGGLVAIADTKFAAGIYSSYNTGNVTGKKYVGGLAGIAKEKYRICNSYTCGKVNKEGNNAEIGIAVGNSDAAIYDKVYYQRQDSLNGAGNCQDIEGLEEKTEQELKSEVILEKLDDVSDYSVKSEYIHHWKLNSLNNGYPDLVVETVVENDTELREVSVESDKKIYYAYLTLKAKPYTVKSIKLKEADYYDGKYHIDYSGIKTTQSTAIGISIEKKDLKVQGFKYEQGSRLVFASSYLATESNSRNKINVKKEKSEKKYYCIGSDFVSVVQIGGYPSKYTTKTSGVKFIYNWEDDNRCADSLLDYITKTYRSRKITHSSRLNCDVSKPVTKKEKILSFRTGFHGSEVRFVWRKKGDIKWNMDYRLTFSKLKDFGVNGTTLQMRFLEDYVVNVYKKETSDEKEYYTVDDDNSLGDEFYGNIMNVKIPKLRRKPAPKIKIDVDNLTINIKNGMQISFDKNEWYTIYPYSKNGTYMDGYFDYENIYDSATDIYTCCKVESISLVDRRYCKYLDKDIDYGAFGQYIGKDIYVRTLGKNNLPSEIATVHLPDEMSYGPELSTTSVNGKIVVKDITRGKDDILSNPKYEYCIGEDIDYVIGYIEPKIDIYDKYDTLIKWKDLKEGMEINNKLSTKYTHIIYKAIGDAENGITKVTKKSYSKTFRFMEKGKGGDLKNTDIYIRRKGDKSSGTLPSMAVHYIVNGDLTGLNKED